MLAQRPPSPGQSAAHRSPVTLQDLLDDLLWPHLLRSWKLALAPGRVALCFLLVLVCGGIVAVFQGATGHAAFDELGASVKEHVDSILGFTQHGGPNSAAKGAYELFVSTPATFVTKHPVAALVLLPLILFVWCGVGGAVCRSCACEVSLRAALPWRQAVKFGARKSLALFAALAGPLVLVWIACLVLRLLGLIFFTTKVMGILGSLLFIAPLLLCLVMATACIAYLLAHSLLIPAVACEGTDSFDAVQRCYAYVLARPGRIVGYILVSLLATVPAVLIVTMIVVFAITMAIGITGAPFAKLDFLSLPMPSEEGSFPFTRAVVHVWSVLILMVAASYFISLYFCACTNLYLVVRRLVDGQDMTELWTPSSPASPVAAAAVPAQQQAPAPFPEKADYT